MVARASYKQTTTTDLIAFVIYASRFPFSFPSSGGNKLPDMPTLNWTWSTIGALKNTICRSFVLARAEVVSAIPFPYPSSWVAPKTRKTQPHLSMQKTIETVWL